MYQYLQIAGFQVQYYVSSIVLSSDQLQIQICKYVSLCNISLVQFGKEIIGPEIEGMVDVFVGALLWFPLCCLLDTHRLQLCRNTSYRLWVQICGSRFCCTETMASQL